MTTPCGAKRRPLPNSRSGDRARGGAPKLPTEAKVAYDGGNLYVFVRAFDPHPDSIITVLARRDYFTPTDMVWLFLDSYHDRRTGFEFGVNPSGVKLDAQIYNDGNEDFVTAAVSPSYSRRTNDIQSLGSTRDTSNVTHYLFGHLEQKQLALTMRVTYPFTANMSLQVYAQPFISKGTFSNVRELSANPRAADYDRRYQAYGDTAYTNHIGGFNFKQFRSNVVFRWEYRPGSTLFVVWSQGRQGSTGVEGTRSFGGDMNDLFNLRPDNSFLVKLSYWINR